MGVHKSAEMSVDIDFAWQMGEVMGAHFRAENLAVGRKPDDTDVTAADLDISARTAAFYAQRGRPVVSEERGGTAPYGTRTAKYLDPIDYTKDFVAARRERRTSAAAFSLGNVVGGEFRGGVVVLPLLEKPHLYWGEQGAASRRVLRRGGLEWSLGVDHGARTGIVLVSENDYPHIERLRRMDGITPVRLGGAVFKALCVADPDLLETAPGVRAPRGQQVIGFVSPSAAAHDYAAAVPIVRNAKRNGGGGYACALDGNELPLKAGKHGCIFAANEFVRDLLVGVMQAGV